MARKIVTREEARAKGLPTFYTGKPCPRGHYSERYTNSGKCIECHTARNKGRKRGKAGKAKSKAVSRAAPAVAGAALVPINSEPLTGEVMNGDWRFHADRITAAWQKAVGSIIETGALLIEAKDAVDYGDWLKLTKELPFGERTAQRLMEIARHPVLSDPTRGSHLPPSWRTLYELTRLPEPVLIAKIEDRTINPEMERSDVELIAASFTKEVAGAALSGALSAGKVHYTPGTSAAVEVEVKKSEPKVIEPEWPKSSPDDDEVTEAEIIEEAPPSLAELVERWQNSLATMAGDTIALPANWDRVFGNWREFDKPSDLITLAEQAADTWAKIVEIMRRKAEAA